jgi:hypothetical protein
MVGSAARGGAGVTDALGRAAALGPFFRWDPAGAAEGWRSWTDLTDGDVLADRVEVARAALARLGGLPVTALPVRAVASVVFLGWAARVVSPPLGAAALTGTLPVASLRWRPTPSGPLSIGYASVRPAARADAATLLETTVGDLLTPVLAAFRERFRLSPLVLWGNVASALGGAAGLITDADPAAGDRAADLVATMLTLPPLVGTGTLVRPDPAHPRRFLVRHNCCLYYRIPGGGTCGDCVLTPEADRQRAWRAALSR